MRAEQIKHMVGRFLAWRLPENFNPDGGISFKADFNEHTAHPMKHQPVGTNLFGYDQAEAMVRHMLEGVPGPWHPIDTAPRDGSHILVTDAHRGGLGYCGPVNGAGFRDPADWCDVVHWFEDPEEPGFYSTSWGGDQEHPFTNLTHWMPLPTAPRKAAD